MRIQTKAAIHDCGNEPQLVSMLLADRQSIAVFIRSAWLSVRAHGRVGGGECFLSREWIPPYVRLG
jgi:hypothetical protein